MKGRYRVRGSSESTQTASTGAGSGTHAVIGWISRVLRISHADNEQRLLRARVKDQCLFTINSPLQLT